MYVVGSYKRISAHLTSVAVVGDPVSLCSVGRCREDREDITFPPTHVTLTLLHPNLP
jgi:hypothetical protein